jgi:hypothetical protein
MFDLEQLYDRGRSVHHTLYHKRLADLVGEFGALPISFHIGGIILPPHPLFGGGFSVSKWLSISSIRSTKDKSQDIYKGILNGEDVCVKAIRIFMGNFDSDRTRLYKVPD